MGSKITGSKKVIIILKIVPIIVNDIHHVCGHFPSKKRYVLATKYKKVKLNIKDFTRSNNQSLTS
jgi:hypothetical protein